MVVPIDGVVDGSKDEPISQCKFCGRVTPMVYNCNNERGCHEVFISCADCAAEMRGCCSQHCRSGTLCKYFPLVCDQIFSSRQEPDLRGP